MITNTSYPTEASAGGTPQGDPVPDSHSDRPFVGTTVSIDERLAQIEVERARITQLDEEAARLRHEKEVALAARRHEAIQTIPALLQVATVQEAIALMRGEVSPSGGKGSRYPDAVRAQVKQMMEANTPIAQIAKHMRIGEATLWIWKKAWGLTHTHVKQPKPRRATRARKVKTPMTPERKAELVSRIKAGKTPVAQLAKEFNVSRARAYQIIAKEHLTTPGLKRAA